MKTPNRPQPSALSHQLSAFDYPLGSVVYSCTRAQAVAEGFQIEVTKTAAEAGIRWPVFLTRAVFDNCVAVPPGAPGQERHDSRSERRTWSIPWGTGPGSKPSRLWNIVWMLRFALRRAYAGVTRLPFALYIRTGSQRAKLVKLIATCGPIDSDNPQPAITVMMPDEG